MYANSCGSVGAAGNLPGKYSRQYCGKEKIMKTITEITTKQPAAAILRLAPYCRVSSDSEDQRHSFAAQVKYYTEYTAAHPEYELVDIYADEGITGTEMKKRDDFNRLLRDCRKRKIDRVITKTVSRFARNTAELLTVVRALKELGVSVYFEEQGIDTETLDLEMILTFPGMAAQKESETISENMRWSYRKRMETGEFNCCRAAYGYSLIDGELQINEAEAKVVRRIFHLYLQGCGKQAIANQLNTEGVPKRYGQKTWYLSAIDYVLNNERYMGDSLLQKSYTTETLPFRKNGITEKRRSIMWKTATLPLSAVKPIRRRRNFKSADLQTAMYRRTNIHSAGC